jgi:hypothetical protein
MGKFTPSKESVLEFFDEYKRNGGRHDGLTFSCNLQVFFGLTFDAYIAGEGDRAEAWAKWVEHIGSDYEAQRYFNAVDAVHPYS